MQGRGGKGGIGKRNRSRSKPSTSSRGASTSADENDPKKLREEISSLQQENLSLRKEKLQLEKVLQFREAESQDIQKRANGGNVDEGPTMTDLFTEERDQRRVEVAKLMRENENLKVEIQSLEKQVQELQLRVDKLTSKCESTVEEKLYLEYGDWVQQFHAFIAKKIDIEDTSWAELSYTLGVEKTYAKVRTKDVWDREIHTKLKGTLDHFHISTTMWDESVRFSKHRNDLAHGFPKPEHIEVPAQKAKINRIHQFSLAQKEMLKVVLDLHKEEDLWSK